LESEKNTNQQIKILVVTGHRPPKITYNGINAYDKQIKDRLVRLAEASLKFYQPKVTITGMALGFDQAIAKACINLEIPFIAAIPHRLQAHRWPDWAKVHYDYLLEHAAKRITISHDPFMKPFHLLERNKWMVSRGDALLALWNGSQGGTEHAVKLAQKKNIPIYNVWDKWKKGDPCSAERQQAESCIQRPTDGAQQTQEEL
jgi:uncharacterized phage-like protein YoqJ